MQRDRVLQVLIWVFTGLVLASYFALLYEVSRHGFQNFGIDYLLQNPADSGRQGGVFSILVSTILILFTTLVVATPIGLATAVLLAEFARHSNRLGKAVSFSLDVLAAVPSIVFGLFGNALFCKKLGMGFSILSGGITLACMALPLLIRTTEMSIRAVPLEYRLSGSALALSKISILWHLILPAATPGLIAGLILGIGRALAETAALIFTSGYVDRMPESLWDSGRALSIHIFDLSMNVPGGEANAYKSALLLIVLILVTNSIATIVTNHWLRKRIMA